VLALPRATRCGWEQPGFGGLEPFAKRGLAMISSRVTVTVPSSAMSETAACICPAAMAMNSRPTTLAQLRMREFTAKTAISARRRRAWSGRTARLQWQGPRRRRGNRANFPPPRQAGQLLPRLGWGSDLCTP
jgi:hypothetical protein